jgi:hypothetical protein
MNIDILFYFMLAVEGVISIWALFQWGASIFQQRLIILLLNGVFVIEILETWMAFKNIRNLWMIDFATFGECLVLLTIFYSWKTSSHSRKIILFSGVSFVAIWIIAKLSFESFNQMDSYTSAVARIIEIAVSVWILFDVLRESKVILKLDARVWVASAVIIYASGSVLLFALFNTMLKESPSVVKAIWPVNWVLMIVYYLLYARAIWCPVSRENSKVKNPVSAGITNTSQPIHKE